MQKAHLFDRECAGIFPTPQADNNFGQVTLPMPHEAVSLSVVQNSADASRPATKSAAEPRALKDCVEQAMTHYFAQLDGQPVGNVYEMVLSQVEAPLLEVVMRVCQGNQCRAAEMMGLSRGTLRKKLQQHGLL